jgi:hypothetical protein
MAAADAACYEAKRTARGQVRFAQPTDLSAASGPEPTPEQAVG